MASVHLRTSLCSPETISYQAQIASMVLALCYARLQPCFMKQAGAQIRALSRLEKANSSVNVLQGAGSEPGTYSLVTQFPRRVIQMSQYPSEATLADAGLTGRQEALLLEPQAVH